MQRKRVAQQSEESLQAAELKERLTKLLSRWELQSCKSGSKDAACHAQAAKTLAAAVDLIQSKHRLFRSKGNIRQQLQQDLPPSAVLTLLNSTSSNAQQLALAPLAKLSRMQPELVPVDAVPFLVPQLMASSPTTVRNAVTLLFSMLLHARAASYFALWATAGGTDAICTAISRNKLEPSVLTPVLSLSAKLGSLAPGRRVLLRPRPKASYVNQWATILTEVLEDALLPVDATLAALGLLQSFFQEQLFLQEVLMDASLVLRLLKAAWTVFGRQQGHSVAAHCPDLAICTAALSVCCHPQLYACLQQHSSSHVTLAGTAHMPQGPEPAKLSTCPQEWFTHMLSLTLAFSQRLATPQPNPPDPTYSATPLQSQSLTQSALASTSSISSPPPAHTSRISGSLIPSYSSRSASASAAGASSTSIAAGTPGIAATSATAAHLASNIGRHSRSYPSTRFPENPDLAPSASVLPTTCPASSTAGKSVASITSPPGDQTGPSFSLAALAAANSPASPQQLQAAQVATARACCCLLLPPVHAFGLKPPKASTLVRITQLNELISIIRCLTDGMRATADTLNFCSVMQSLRFATHSLLQSSALGVAAKLYRQVYEMFLEQVHSRAVGSWDYGDGLLDVLLLTLLLEMKCFCQLHSAGNEASLPAFQQLSAAEKLMGKCDVALSTRSQYVAAVRDILLRVALPWPTGIPKSFSSSRIPQPSGSPQSTAPSASVGLHHQLAVPNMPSSYGSATPAAANPTPSSPAAASSPPSGIPKFSVSLGMSLSSSLSVVPDQQELATFMQTCAQLVVKMVKGMASLDGMVTLLPLLRSLLTALWVLHPMVLDTSGIPALCGPSSRTHCAGIQQGTNPAQGAVAYRGGTSSYSQGMVPPQHAGGWLNSMANSLDTIVQHSLLHASVSVCAPAHTGRSVCIHTNCSIASAISSPHQPCPLCAAPQGTETFAYTPVATLPAAVPHTASSLASRLPSEPNSHNAQHLEAGRPAPSVSGQAGNMRCTHSKPSEASVCVVSGAAGTAAVGGCPKWAGSAPCDLFPGPATYPTWLMFSEVQCAAALVVTQLSGRMGFSEPWLDCSPLRFATHLSDLCLVTQDGGPPASVHAAVLAARCPKLLDGPPPKPAVDTAATRAAGETGETSDPQQVEAPVDSQQNVAASFGHAHATGMVPDQASYYNGSSSCSSNRISSSSHHISLVNAPAAASTSAAPSMLRSSEDSHATTRAADLAPVGNTLRLNKRITRAMLDAILQYVYAGCWQWDPQDSSISRAELVKLCAALKLPTFSGLLKCQLPVPGSTLGHDFVPDASALCPTTVQIDTMYCEVLDLPVRVDSAQVLAPASMRGEDGAHVVGSVLSGPLEAGTSVVGAEGAIHRQVDVATSELVHSGIGSHAGSLAGGGHVRAGVKAVAFAHAAVANAGASSAGDTVAGSELSSNMCMASAYAHLLLRELPCRSVARAGAACSLSPCCDVLLAGSLVVSCPVSNGLVHGSRSIGPHMASSAVCRLQSSSPDLSFASGCKIETEMDPQGGHSPPAVSAYELPFDQRNQQSHVPSDTRAGSGSSCRTALCSVTAFVPAHKVLLSAKCEYFQVMFSERWNDSGHIQDDLPYQARSSVGTLAADAAQSPSLCSDTAATRVLPVACVPGADAEVLLVLVSYLYTGRLCFDWPQVVKSPASWTDSICSSPEAAGMGTLAQRALARDTHASSGSSQPCNIPRKSNAGNLSNGSQDCRCGRGGCCCCSGASESSGGCASVQVSSDRAAVNGGVCSAAGSGGRKEAGTRASAGAGAGVATGVGLHGSSHQSGNAHPGVDANGAGISGTSHGSESWIRTKRAIDAENSSKHHSADVEPEAQCVQPRAWLDGGAGTGLVLCGSELAPVRCVGCHDVLVCCRLMSCSRALLMPEVLPLCVQHATARMPELTGGCLLAVLTTAAALELREVMDAAVDVCVKVAGVPALQSSSEWAALDSALQQLLLSEHLHHLKHGDANRQDAAGAIPPASVMLPQLADELQQLASNPFLLSEPALS